MSLFPIQQNEMPNLLYRCAKIECFLRVKSRLITNFKRKEAQAGGKEALKEAGHREMIVRKYDCIDY